MKKFSHAVVIGCLLVPSLVCAKPDPEVINAIRDEGFNHSQVMQNFQYLTDTIGPRLTNSPKMREASLWALEKLKSWGLSNAHQEAFEFGRGWTYDRATIDLLAPRKTSLHGIPLAWDAGNGGPARGRGGVPGCGH